MVLMRPPQHTALIRDRARVVADFFIVSLSNLSKQQQKGLVIHSNNCRHRTLASLSTDHQKPSRVHSLLH